MPAVLQEAKVDLYGLLGLANERWTANEKTLKDGVQGRGASWLSVACSMLKPKAGRTAS